MTTDSAEREAFEKVFPNAHKERWGDSYMGLFSGIWEGWKARAEWAEEQGLAAQQGGGGEECKE